MGNLFAWAAFMLVVYSVMGVAALLVLVVSAVLLADLIGKLGVFLLVGMIAAIHLYWNHVHK